MIYYGPEIVAKDFHFWKQSKKRSNNDTAEDRGSYNYNRGSHALSDVVPWIAWGNSSETYGNKGRDTTSCEQRRSEYNPHWWSNTTIALEAIRKLKMYGTVA
jgi:hypothetical protein